MNEARNDNNMMDDATVFAKTEVGNDEVLRRTLGLPNDLRSLLLLIDGRRSLSMLRQVSVALRNSSAPIIFLEDNGFIERAGGNKMQQNAPMAPMMPQKPMYQASEPQRLEPLANMEPERGQRYAAPQAPAPMQAPAPAPYMASQTQYAQSQYQLSDLKGNMIQFVSSALGADGSHAVARIQTAQSLADLQQIARKIYDVLKAYSGVKTAEKFMQQFEGQLNLR